MKETRRDEKKKAIREAAYALLVEKGYKAASMLEIARRASASNETLYRWYGNKQGLFREMVEENASGVRELIDGALAEGAPLMETLSRLGPLLLKLVTGERAVALNRAAAADVHETGTLGPTIAASGRQTIVPMIADLIRKASDGGEVACGDPDEAAEIFVALLIGDVQIACVIGARGPLSDAEIAARSARALDGLERTLGRS
ncbi:TetR/AcrR family transcriptional regulator [Rhodobium gokarnense]|uniref:AcrR family transcriptional regulator n=1 Tax=Rhodobium gokarnense TaxID=364296 RepID=A0ABT3HBP3_9HYPH|nr:TetR/AcrR family transcriptional regulator [Rhodobium gokarnense]MCW2307805.1 AcrR family transcriptional regulator [Rhodobium gokarnense]